MLLAPGPFAGEGYAQCAAKALAEDVNWSVAHVRSFSQPAQAGFGVVEGAFDVRVAGGFAIAPVVDGEDVVAFLGQPGHVEDVAANVLGVAMEEVDGSLGIVLGRFRGQPPAVQGFAVGGVEIDVLVAEVQTVRGDVGGPVRIKEEAAATRQHKNCHPKPDKPGRAGGQK